MNSLQTDETLIRCCILLHLIWVCTVCQLPFYGFPDNNGLKEKHTDLIKWLLDAIYICLEQLDVSLVSICCLARTICLNI